MKKLLFSACIAFAMTSCCNSQKAVITGELENIENQKIYITENVDGKYIQTDSADVIDGKFTLTSENVYPREGILTFEKIPRLGHFTIIEEGAISVKGDMKKFQEIVATGTKSLELKAAHALKLAPFNASFKELNNAFRKIDRKNLSKEEVAKQVNAIKAEAGVQNAEMEKIVMAEIAANSNNVFGASLIAAQEPGTYEAIEKLLVNVGTDMPANKYIDDLNAMKAKFETVRIGAVAPDFTVLTPEGKEISLSSLRGQVVLLDFWASWCGPCRASNPSVVALYNEFKDKGFTVFGVSLDNSNAKDKWLKAIKDDKLTWHHGSDLKGWGCVPAKLYGVKGIPRTFLIDKDGKIAGDNLHGEALKAKVAELTK